MAKTTTHTQPRIGKRQHIANPHTTILFPVEPIKVTRVQISATAKPAIYAAHMLIECVCCGYKFQREHLAFGGRCVECHTAYKLDTAKHGMVAYHAETDV